jgi:hypothetical protein
VVKRVLFGFLWCVVFYFTACFIVGAVAGAIAGVKDPSNASLAGEKAGTSLPCIHFARGSFAFWSWDVARNLARY